MQLSNTDRAAILNAPTNYRTVSTSDGATIRITARPISTPQGNYYEVIGLSTSDITKTLHQLLLIEALIGVGAVAGGAAHPRRSACG